jgi:hypothetical protein
MSSEDTPISSAILFTRNLSMVANTLTEKGVKAECGKLIP